MNAAQSEVIPIPVPISTHRPRRTDLGNAERLVEKFGDRIRYSPERKKWLVWKPKAGRWVWDEGVALQAMVKSLIKDLYSEASQATDDEAKKLAAFAADTQKAGRIRAAIALAQNEPGVQIKVEELDADPHLLNCSNGTVDLRTGELLKHDRSHLITKSTGVDYHPKARSNAWDGVLSDACGGDDELQMYLQRVAGYAATGLANERAFFFMYGPPGTSKSTLIDALHAGLGDYAQPTSSDTWLARYHAGGNRDDLVDLQGVRLATSVEVKKGAKWDEAIIKKFTGGDLIRESRKFENLVAFRPQCTILLAANDAPEARDDDAGLWARMRRIPLDNVIPPEKQIRDLKVMLTEPTHAKAILQWIVDGALQWKQDGIGTCLAVERSTAEYQRESDRLKPFLHDEIVFEDEQRVPKSAFRMAYENWCRDAGVPVLGHKEIAARLRTLGVVDGKSGSKRVWVGMRLRTFDDEVRDTRDT